jgi:hypothetical protein
MRKKSKFLTNIAFEFFSFLKRRIVANVIYILDMKSACNDLIFFSAIRTIVKYIFLL